MQVVFVNECKTCEISNQCFVMFSFSRKKETGYDIKTLQNKTVY